MATEVPLFQKPGSGEGGRHGDNRVLHDFEAFFDASPTPLLVVRPPDWTIVAVNQARLQLTETTREQNVGRRLFDAFPDNPAETEASGVRNLARSLEQVLSTKQPHLMAVQRYDVRNAAGMFVERWWSPVNTPVLGGDGEVDFVIHRVEEVTDMVRLRDEAVASEKHVLKQRTMIDRLLSTEAALRASEEFSRRVLTASADCVKVMSLAGELEFMSEGGMCVMEVDDFSLLRGSNWLDAWPPEEQGKVREAMLAAKAGGTGRFHGFAPTAKGTPRWWDVIVTPISGPSGAPEKLLSVSRDITEREQAAVALRESETRFRVMADAVPQIVWITDAEGRVEFFNKQWSDYTGVPFEPTTAAEVAANHVHPDDAPATAAAYREALRAGTSFRVEHRIRSAAGEYRWFLVRGEPYRDGGAGEIVRWFGASVDIHDRKLAEEALRQLNETLEAQVAERTAERDRMWETSPDLMLVIDFKGVFLRVNPAWTTLLGYAPEELVGHHVNEFVIPEDHAGTVQAYETAASGGSPQVENRYRHKDGSIRWISWTAAPASDVTYATGRDVTREKNRQAELEAAQEALRQSQKMEAMGSLTGGVAHDFNNLLSPIIGSLDMLVRKGIGSERERRLINGALQSAERAKTLVQRLLAFARRQPLQPVAVDLNRLIPGIVELITSTLGPTIDVRVDLAPDLTPAKADPNQLEMALLNLAVNARDAMPGGGELVIGAKLESVRNAHSSGLRPGHYVRLDVGDTGVGMDEETRRRAVEPFFSTKGVGRGTGLGLSMAHGLAAQLGGALTIDTRLGSGTTVTLWLPISAEPIGEEDEGFSTSDRGIGRGTVLLVDDEELVRMSTADMLIDLGFEVVEAASAEDALQLVKSGMVPDLLVTDHLMPGMNGADLASEVRALRPDLPVLVVSGYAEVEGIAPELPRLTKPFRSTELTASVAALVPGVD